MEIIDRWTDRAVAMVTGIPKMFYEGWGDPELLDWLVEQSRDVGPPADIEVRWEDSKRHRDGSHTFSGWFTTPARHLPLPPEVRAAYFQMLLPPDAFDGPRPGMCVHLAGTGDLTFAARKFLARPLLKHQNPRDRIGAIILQNPYYGRRKPHGQRQTRLRRMTDQVMMNLATVQEARALLKWLRGEGFARVGVTGYSMGGFMAGFSAQTVPFPVAAIPCASGDTAVATLVDSPLRDICDWKKLAEEAGGADHADMLMRQTLSALALSEHGTPVAPEAAIIVGVRNDEFVPPAQPRALHDHWPGAELRWIDGGHTTGWLLHADKMREAIFDAFQRLQNVDLLQAE
jgi:dienelactone hydrolase